MDKKKSMFKNFNDYCVETYGCPANRYVIPNETRVAGKYFLIQSFLRQHILYKMHSVDAKYSGQFSEFMITHSDWKFLQEIEGILRIFVDLISMKSQRDLPGFIALCWFQVAFTWAQILTADDSLCIDLNKNWKPSTLANKIPQVKIKRVKMQPRSHKLLERLDKEFTNYLPVPDSDMILSILIHPVMLGVGLP